jgi:PPIC-type PPIASE domain
MDGRRRLARVVREPLVHFAVLGALLFAVHGLLHRGPTGAPDPAARPPVSRRIAVDQPLVDGLVDSFKRAWKRDPTRDELAEMVLDHVDDEVLYREGLAQGLDRDDPAVRRRLIEKVTVMNHEPPPEPSDAELRRWFEDRRHHFRDPGRLWFRQLFFDPGVRRGQVSADARAALARLDGDSEAAASLGDTSPLPPQVEGMTELQVAHLFGKGFLDSLAGLEVGKWQGPLSSTQGVHLVRLARRQASRDPPFDEARAAVRADWITARSKGYLEAASRLMPRYRIELAPAVRRRLEGARLLAPVLEAAR